MTKLLDVATVGDPILRQVAPEIVDYDNPELQELIDNLISTAMNAQGVGIAAPQVSQSYRLFIVASHPNDRYPHAPIMQPTPMLNPVILEHSEEMVEDWEGCLSVPGVRGLVPRYKNILVAYRDRSGKLHQQEFSDFIARIVQHELDHLNGILFIDRQVSVISNQ